METFVVVVVALWAIRRLIVDASFAVRGQTPPAMAGRSGRYGMRGYAADVWSDAWRSANDRRVTRRDARAARRAAGGSRFPRLARARVAAGAWWRSAGGSRAYHRRGGQVTDELRPGAWDRAWDAVEQRRANNAARRAAGTPRFQRLHRLGQAAGGLWAVVRRRGGNQGEPAAGTGRRGTDPQLVVPPAPTGPVQRLGRPYGSGGRASTPEPPAAPRLPAPTADGQIYRSGNAGREPMGARPVNGKRQGDKDPGAVSGGTPGTAPERAHPNGHSGADASTTTPARSGRHQHEEGNGMAEATGLTSAISYADAQRQAAEGNVMEVESWIASLEAHEVTGEAVAAARQAMEQYQAAGASLARAKSALDRHMQVKEAYDANQDAGSREFVTSE
jgi:hypothetical protein